jgi:hypothetical protein
MTTDPLRLIEDRLSAQGCQPRRTGTHVVARCPAHDDREPSLSVSPGRDQAVVVHCHAGCAPDDVIAALDLTWSELAPPAATPSGGRGLGEVVAEYEYTDEAGVPLFRVRRFDPKAFRQQRWDGRRWVHGLKDTRRVLYRLPAVHRTIEAGETVWLCEGEKDADRLAAAGVTATCSPMGAGKWRPEYAEALAGARVMVVADADEPGYAHALAAGASLTDHRAAVTYVLPAEDCKDAADHLAAGHGLDEFRLTTAAELGRLAHPDAGEDDAGDEDEGQALPEGGNQASRLVALAQAEYRIVLGADSRAYAVERNGPAIALSLRGRDGLRTRLARRLFELTRTAASSKALGDALGVLEGIAATTDPEPIGLRVAVTPAGAVALDLGTVDGRAVVAGPAGWDLAERSPVLFRRSALTAALPAPERGGNLDALAELINVDTAGFRLLVGWLAAALLPDIPHPVLCLFGEQGTAKTTAAKLLVSLIDPSPAPVRSAPSDAKDWAVTASASWLVAIDNVSTIPSWLSDTLCRAVTGEGFLTRALFTDDDVSVLAFRRVIALTSIDAGRLAGDLAERLLPVELTPITADRRRPDAEITAEYHRARPALLGALLDLLVQVLEALPTVRLDESPRMADFARTLAALDHVTGWTTLPDYLDAAAGAADTVLEADPIADGITRLAEAGRWTGTAGELHALLTPEHPPRGWPANGRVLAGAVRRLAPALRSNGVTVDFTRSPDGARRRLITVHAAEPAAPSGPIPASAASDPSDERP